MCTILLNFSQWIILWSLCEADKKIGLNFEKCKCCKEYYCSSVAALVTFCSLELSIVKQLLFSLSLGHCINCLGLGLEFRVFVCLFIFWGFVFFVCLFFFFVLIRPASLVLKEHFFCILYVITRLVGLISTKRMDFFLAASYAIGLWFPLKANSYAYRTK